MRRYIYVILAIIGIFLAVMPITVPIFKSNASYSVLNTGPSGTSSFGYLLYKTGSVQPILVPYDSFSLGSVNGTLVVIGPSLDFSGPEVSQLKRFLEKGGTLVLADDSKVGNRLLSALKLPERFSKDEVISVTYSGNSQYPVTREITGQALTSGANEVVLHNPHAILNARNPLLYTSNASLLNGKYGAFPIIDEVPYKKGRIVLISDPDIFTNALFQKNAPFLQNLILHLPGRNFYIDEAHHGDLNVYSSGSVVLRRGVNRNLAFYYVLFIAVLIITVESGLASMALQWSFSLLEKLFPAEEESVEDAVRALVEEGFDEDKLKRMLREIETGSKLGGAYER
ncbi:hypothetical protein A3L09_10180 [Thermococcus profundus]|uniref:DUF4350 domain-containing protein n=1 Tax=Thermococcus profundus TaxID=49899 RepID=A0A2Z2MNX0_THEPR|nr:DUF4350 domain-containing protein [Thermococcus profundus]ASJ03598.1 hypothetical protein A3L09_10180 [Thermococcus profundus]